MPNTLFIIAIVLLVLQVGLFFVIRAQKRKLTKPSEIELKYGIQSRLDAWRVLNKKDLPEEDRIAVETLYNQMQE